MSFGETRRFEYNKDVGKFKVFLTSSPSSEVDIGLIYKGKIGEYKTDFLHLQITKPEEIAETAMKKSLESLMSQLECGERTLDSRETYTKLLANVIVFVSNALNEHEKLIEE